MKSTGFRCLFFSSPLIYSSDFFPLLYFFTNQWPSQGFSRLPQIRLLFQQCYLIHILLSTLTYFKMWIRLLIELTIKIQIQKKSLWKKNKTLATNKKNGFCKSLGDWLKWGRRGNGVLVNYRLTVSLQREVLWEGNHGPTKHWAVLEKRPTLMPLARPHKRDTRIQWCSSLFKQESFKLESCRESKSWKTDTEYNLTMDHSVWKLDFYL